MRTRLAAAVERIRDSRRMTERFLGDLSPDDWFWQPAPGMNSIAWHVGHLAFAQYFLCLKRLRGRTEADEPLVPTDFLKRYKQGSTPSGDPADNYPVERLLEIFQGVHELALAELEDWTDERLAEPSHPPHPVFETKFGAVEWCSQHELMHAGQIVLVRRLMGRKPTW